MRELERYHLTTITPDYQKRWVYWDREKLPVIQGESYGPNPMPDAREDAELQRVMHMINFDASSISFGKGFLQPNSVHLDICIEDYIQVRLKPTKSVAAFLFSRAFTLTTGGHPMETSALSLLNVVAGMGSAERAFFDNFSRVNCGMTTVVDAIIAHVR